MINLFKKPIPEGTAPEIDFYVWFSEIWTATGGVITQATAADMLGKTNGRIRQMIDEKKIKEYRYGNLSFVSFIEIYRMARIEAYEKAQKMLKEELKQHKDNPEMQRRMEAAFEEMLNAVRRIAEI